MEKAIKWLKKEPMVLLAALAALAGLVITPPSAALAEAIEGVEREEKVIEAETTVVDASIVDNYIK